MTRTEKEERRRLLADGLRQQGRALFYEANPPLPAQLNSFQRWASDYARAFGLSVTPFSNWVMIAAPDGSLAEVMTSQGLQAFCNQHHKGPEA
jgi:hypothetical protein